MELALKVGEEAGQNSPTDTCLVLPDSVPSVQVVLLDSTTESNSSTLHYILSTLDVILIKPPNNPLE